MTISDMRKEYDELHAKVRAEAAKQSQSKWVAMADKDPKEFQKQLDIEKARVMRGGNGVQYASVEYMGSPDWARRVEGEIQIVEHERWLAQHA